MLVRTLSIQHDEQNVLTAALLFGFAIAKLNQNFLAYSLNEDVGDNDSLIYLVSLHKEVDDYSLHTLTSAADGQEVEKVFKQILQEVATDNTGATNASSFYLLDLSEQTVTSAVMKEHYTLHVAKNLIVKLFNFQPSASFGPALETGVPVSPGDTETHPPTVHKQHDPKFNSKGDADAALSDQKPFNQDTETQEISDEESVFQDLDAEHLLTEVETTFEEFSELAEKLTLQKNQYHLQQKTLASRELQLQEKELLLNQKKEVLLQNYSEQQLQQNKRQSELDLREKTLQRKAMELSIKLKKLEDAKNKLSTILKALQFNSSTN